MIYLIKINIVILLLIISIEVKAITENKIIFSINENAYTSLDLKNRLNYLGLKNIETSDYKEKAIIEDYLTSLIFSKYFEENKKNNQIDLIIKKEFDLINKEFKKKNKNSENKDLLKIIKKNDLMNNIKYDLHRKLLIEEKLELKRKIILSNNINEINNVYNINISFISFQSNEKINKEINNVFDLEKLKKLLNDKNITYIYKNKELNFTENIHKNIKKSIINNRNNFYINNNDNLIIGTIIRKIKSENGIFFIFYQIDSRNKLEEEEIMCENLDQLRKNKKIEISKIKETLYKNLNEKIKQNIIKINDMILFKKNNKFQYLILCEINYDNKNFEKINISNKVDFLITDIEKNFIVSTKKLYLIQKFYE